MNTPAPHLSSLALDALALGALPPGERTHAEQHLAHCSACRARAQTQEEARAHFSARVLPATLPSLRARALPWWRRPRAWTPLLGLALATAAALLVVVRAPEQAAPADEEPLYGVKGGASLGVYAHRGERVWKVAQGEALAPGDQVRFRVQPGGLPYLLLVSVDGAGQVSVYHPFGGRRSARVAAPDSAPLELPGSVVLDAAPGPERIYALFSEAPLDVDAVSPVLESLARGGPRAIRGHTQLSVSAEAQASFLFEKSRP